MKKSRQQLVICDDEESDDHQPRPASISRALASVRRSSVTADVTHYMHSRLHLRPKLPSEW
eukprot:scaffold533955_cov44-Prasinocladus_malaysianus.AAC.1